ncbi:MAG: hypothetical protein GPJ18_23310, partial [Microcystis aeruginosa F13-15]|nr:hypothetical protein [Microcystis aeruginosa F13-15]
MLTNPGVLAFSAPTYTLTENGSRITQVVVNRTGGSDTEVSATITVNNGTATAADYNNTPIKVTFAHGDSAPKIITIPIKEDSQFEAVETLNLSLTNPTNGVTIGTQNTAIVKIIDNDNFVFNNIDIQPTKLEKLTLPIPTALKQYETLSSELDKAKVKLDTTEEQLRLANDDYSFAKETFEGSLSKQKSLTETLQNLGNKKTALISSFTQSKTQNEQKQKDIQKNIDDAYTRLKAETNAGIKDGIQKEINGYLIQIQEQQNLLSIATTKYNQELAGVIFQIDDSNQELQGLESNIIPKQVEDLEKKNQALVDVKTAWEGNKQAVTVADKALGDLLTDYAFLKTQDYSSKFLQDTVDSLNQKIGALQADLTALKDGNGSNSEIAALEKAILEKQKIVAEVQDYQKTVLAGELEFKQELETRKGTSADHEASVKVALGNNNIEGYVSLNSQLANQLKGLTTVWVDNLEDNHNLTIKVWNGSQATSQGFDSLTSYIDENLATPYGDYYLNEIQLDEALQIRESTVRRRDALADSVDFVTDALFLAKKQLQEYQDLAKLGQHYSDLTKYEKEFNQLNVVESKLATINQFQQKLVTTTAKLTSVKEDNKNKLALAGQKGAITRPETGNKYFWTNSTSWEDAQAQGEAVGGNLVTINDGNEQNWAIQIRPRNVGYFWLGLTDKFQEGRWQWISGEPITYTYWRPGEPNNHSGAENYGLVWINNEWNDGTNGSLPGLIEINLQSLAQKETTITQDIEKTRAGFNSAVTDLLKSLDSPFLRNTESLKAGIIQKQALNDSYLTQAKWYSDQAAIYWDKSKKQGATWVEYTQVQKTKVSKGKKVTYWETVTTTHNDPNWVTWDDYTKKSQALQQQSADFLKSISDDVQAFISQSDLVLQPKLINAVSDEVTNKSQDLVVQIDLNPSNVKYITSSIAVEYQGQKYYGWITYDNSVLKRQGQEWLSGDKIQDFGFNFLGKTYYRQDFYWDTAGISLGFVDGNPVAALFAFNTPDGRNFGFGQESTSNINWTHGFLQWDYPNARWIENVGTIDFSDPANVQHLEWQEQWIETNLQNYVKQRRDSITPNGVNDQTIANLQSLRLETAYLTLQSQQNPDKVQSYLTEYKVIQDGNLSILPNVSFTFINQAQGLKTGYWADENNSEQLIGDFNGDGKDDIVNLQSDGISNNWIALSNGNGTFNLKGAYSLTNSNNSYQTGLTASFWGNENNSEQLIGDFNGDGKDDIVNLQSDGTSNNWIALSNG